MKILLTAFIILCAFGSGFAESKNEELEYFLYVEVTAFQIYGNGESLNLPIFTEVVSSDEIVYQVDVAEYYYSKLSRLYDFKRFEMKNFNFWTGFANPGMIINDGAPIYRYHPQHYEFELTMDLFDGKTGSFTARTALKPDPSQAEPAIRHHRFDIPTTQSASIGGLYDEYHNRGFLFIISLDAVEKTEDMNDVKTALEAYRTTVGDSLFESKKAPGGKGAYPAIGVEPLAALPPAYPAAPAPVNVPEIRTQKMYEELLESLPEIQASIEEDIKHVREMFEEEWPEYEAKLMEKVAEIEEAYVELMREHEEELIEEEERLEKSERSREREMAGERARIAEDKARLKEDLARMEKDRIRMHEDRARAEHEKAELEHYRHLKEAQQEYLKQLKRDLPRLQERFEEQLPELDEEFLEQLTEIKEAIKEEYLETVEELSDKVVSAMFVEYTTPPAPEGGYKALQASIKYPEEMREAGIEGLVVVRAYIETTGTVSSLKVVKSTHEGLNQAAIDAFQSVRFIPAMSGEDPVGVYVAVPFKFRLD